MTTFAFILLLLSLTAVVGTLRLLLDGGHGHAPRSHECDARFQPPATRVH